MFHIIKGKNRENVLYSFYFNKKQNWQQNQLQRSRYVFTLGKYNVSNTRNLQSYDKDVRSKTL